MIASLRRLAVPLGLYAVLIALLAATGLQHPIDHAVYRALYLPQADTRVLRDEFRLVDLPYPPSLRERGDPGPFRERVADLLEALAADPANLPRAVVLDIWFSKDDRGLAPLAAALQRLQQRRVATYASFNPRAEGRRDFDALMREHARVLYDELLSGWGHTEIQAYQGVLSYRRELALPAAGGTRLVPALTTRIARDLQWAGAAGEGPLVLPLGPPAALAPHTVAFLHEGEATRGGRFVAGPAPAVPAPAAAPAGAATTPDWRGRIVLVGSLAEDVNPLAAQAGPQLVLWALDDASQGLRSARAPLDAPGWLAALVIAVSSVVVAAVALLFKFVPAWQTRPGLLAGAGALAGALVLAALAAAALALGTVLPPALPLAGVVLAALLAWRHAHKFMATGAAEGRDTYDVFISYSRRHGDWVARELVTPLQAARGPGGRALKIFFDRASIGVGEPFTSKYMWAIVDSRVFIPVFSLDYYQKAHCRNEMDLAYKRHVDKRLRLAPIAIEPGAVPPVFAVLNVLDVARTPAFLELLIPQLFEATQEAAA